MIDNLDDLIKLFALIGSVFAAYKFKLFGVFKRRYKTEILIKSKRNENGKLYLICTYLIQNTGDMPIKLSSVSLKIYHSNINENIFEYNNNNVKEKIIQCNTKSLISERHFPNKENDYAEHMKIAAGEQSAFPIRRIIDKPGDVLFIYGEFTWKYKNKPAPYHHTLIINNSGLI